LLGVGPQVGVDVQRHGCVGVAEALGDGFHGLAVLDEQAEGSTELEGGLFGAVLGDLVQGGAGLLQLRIEFGSRGGGFNGDARALAPPCAIRASSLG
jgi:hypothetical protein